MNKSILAALRSQPLLECIQMCIRFCEGTVTGVSGDTSEMWDGIFAEFGRRSGGGKRDNAVKERQTETSALSRANKNAKSDKNTILSGSRFYNTHQDAIDRIYANQYGLVIQGRAHRQWRTRFTEHALQGYPLDTAMEAMGRTTYPLSLIKTLAYLIYLKNVAMLRLQMDALDADEGLPNLFAGSILAADQYNVAVQFVRGLIRVAPGPAYECGENLPLRLSRVVTNQKEADRSYIGGLLMPLELLGYVAMRSDIVSVRFRCDDTWLHENAFDASCLTNVTELAFLGHSQERDRRGLALWKLPPRLRVLTLVNVTFSLAFTQCALKETHPGPDPTVEELAINNPSQHNAKNTDQIALGAMEMTDIIRYLAPAATTLVLANCFLPFPGTASKRMKGGKVELARDMEGDPRKDTAWRDLPLTMNAGPGETPVIVRDIADEAPDFAGVRRIVKRTGNFVYYETARRWYIWEAALPNLRNLTVHNVYTPVWITNRLGTTQIVRRWNVSDKRRRELGVNVEDTRLAIEAVARKGRGQTNVSIEELGVFLREFLRQPDTAGLQLGSTTLRGLTIQGKRMFPAVTIKPLDNFYTKGVEVKATRELRQLGYDRMLVPGYDIDFLVESFDDDDDDDNSKEAQRKSRIRDMLLSPLPADSATGYAGSQMSLSALALSARKRLSNLRAQQRGDSPLSAETADKVEAEIMADLRPAEQTLRQLGVDPARTGLLEPEERRVSGRVYVSEPLYRMRHMPPRTFSRQLTRSVLAANVPFLRELRLLDLVGLESIEFGAIPARRSGKVRTPKLVDIRGCSELLVRARDSGNFMEPVLTRSPKVDIHTWFNIKSRAAVTSSGNNSKLGTQMTQLFDAAAERRTEEGKIVAKKRAAEQQLMEQRAQRVELHRLRVIRLNEQEKKNRQKARRVLPPPFSGAISDESGLTLRWNPLVAGPKANKARILTAVYQRVIAGITTRPDRMSISLVNGTLAQVRKGVDGQLSFAFQLPAAGNAAVAVARSIRGIRIARPPCIIGNDGNDAILAWPSEIQADFGPIPRRTGVAEDGRTVIRYEPLFDDIPLECGTIVQGAFTMTLPQMMHLLGAQALAAMLTSDIERTDAEKRRTWERPASEYQAHLRPLRARIWALLLTIRGRNVSKTNLGQVQWAMDNDICIYWIVRTSIAAFLDRYEGAIRNIDPARVWECLSFMDSSTAKYLSRVDTKNNPLAPVTTRLNKGPAVIGADGIVKPRVWCAVVTPPIVLLAQVLQGGVGTDAPNTRNAIRRALNPSVIALSQAMLQTLPIVENRLAQDGDEEDFVDRLDWKTTTPAIPPVKLSEWLGVNLRKRNAYVSAGDDGDFVKSERQALEEERAARREARNAIGADEDQEEEEEDSSSALEVPQSKRWKIATAQQLDAREQQEAAAAPAQVYAAGTEQELAQRRQQRMLELNIDMGSPDAPIIDRAIQVESAAQMLMATAPNSQEVGLAMGNPTDATSDVEMEAQANALSAAYTEGSNILVDLAAIRRPPQGGELWEVSGQLDEALRVQENYLTQAVHVWDLAWKNLQPLIAERKGRVRVERDDDEQDSSDAMSLDLDARICAVCRVPTTTQCAECGTHYCSVEHGEQHEDVHRSIIKCPSLVPAASIVAPADGVVTKVVGSQITISGGVVVDAPAKCNLIRAFPGMMVIKDHTKLAVQWKGRKH